MEDKNFEFELSDSANEPDSFSRLRGKLLKLGFYALVGLMSCGTLGIVVYTFIGRGFIG